MPISLCSELLSISYVAFKKLHVLSDKKKSREIQFKHINTVYTAYGAEKNTA